MRQFLLFFAIAAFFSFSAQAQDCYLAQEAEAEQGIRIHSELMVIGLNCQHLARAGDQNLYEAYRNFTARHEELFGIYEAILLERFEMQGGGDPEARLNAMRTSFANKISNDAATMRPDIFCRRYAPRIVKASDMDHTQLRHWAATVFPSHPVSKPICTRQAMQ